MIRLFLGLENVRYFGTVSSRIKNVKTTDTFLNNLTIVGRWLVQFDIVRFLFQTIARNVFY